MNIPEKPELEVKIKQSLAKYLKIDISEISLHSSLINDLGMDSFGMLVLIHELQQKFNIEITDDEIRNIESVEDIVNYISLHKV
jgi:acyl carrier protein